MVFSQPQNAWFCPCCQDIKEFTHFHQERYGKYDQTRIIDFCCECGYIADVPRSVIRRLYAKHQQLMEKK